MNNWFQNLKSWLQSLLYILAVIYIVSSTFKLLYSPDYDKMLKFIQAPITKHLLSQKESTTTTQNTNNYKILNPRIALATIFIAYIMFFIRAMLGIGKLSVAKNFNTLRVRTSFSNSTEYASKLKHYKFKGYTQANIRKYLLYLVYIMLIIWLIINIGIVIADKYFLTIDIIYLLIVPIVFLFTPSFLLDTDAIKITIEVNNNDQDGNFFELFPHIKTQE